MPSTVRIRTQVARYVLKRAAGEWPSQGWSRLAILWCMPRCARLENSTSGESRIISFEGELAEVIERYKRDPIIIAHAAGLLSSLVLSSMAATGPFFFTD
jgi:hypothetical protein